MSGCTAYQPLPISTSGNGVDRCGNVYQYAAPGVIEAGVCWPPGWPIPAQGLAGASYGGSWSNLSALMTQGAAAANWVISMRRG